MSRFSLFRHVLATSGGGGSPSYDTRFGTSVATDGKITFAAKPGTQSVWVNSSGGNDANDGLTPATAVATLHQASIVRAATYTAGAQLMIAGTGGRTYTDQGYGLITASGFSLIYPTAVLSYDPADASNSAKYGKLLGADRPRILLPDTSSVTSGFSPSSNGLNYIFYQGIEFDGQGVARVMLEFHGASIGIGFQNTLWKGARIDLDLNETTTTANWGSTFLISQSAGYGQWSPDGNASWVFTDGIASGLIIEDCVGVHCGWKMGASRDDALTAGGAHYLGHGIYHGPYNGSMTVRRCIGIDSAQDMYSFRGGFNASCLVSLDEGLVMTFGGYSTSYTEAPNGCVGTLQDMSVLGGSLISTADGGGGAFGARNVIAGSTADNLALFDNPEKGVAPGNGDKLWGGANDNPNISVAVAVSNMRAYNYGNTFEGPNSGAYPISLNYTNCETDVIAPRGTGNSTWGSAPPGYKTRDQIITQVLTDAGVTPGASYAARKAQLVNYLLEYPHLAGQFALALDTYGLQNLGLSPKTHSATTAPSVVGLTAPRSVY